MRWRGWLIGGVALLALLLSATGERASDWAEAEDPPATPATDYGATMTVLAEGREPEPIVQQAWTSYFGQLGVAASTADSWPEGLRLESIDVDFQLDRETGRIDRASGEYELEFLDNNRYASVVVAVQPSEQEAKDAIEEMAAGTGGTAYEVGMAPEFGDDAICLVRTEGAAVEAICAARSGDMLVSALWATDVETVEATQENAAMLARLFVDALHADERPSR